MEKCSNETLHNDLESFKKSVNRRFASLRKTVIDDMQPMVTEMHEYIIEQRGFERGKASMPNNNQEVLREVFGLIWKVLLFAAAVLGIKGLTGQ